MTVKIIPATAAVVVTKIVTPAKPATVTAELSLHEALVLAALEGASNGDECSELFRALGKHALFDQYYHTIKEALTQGSHFVNLHDVRATLHGLRVESEKVPS